MPSAKDVAAAAGRINLKPSEMPGWKATVSTPSTDPDADVRLSTCLGIAPPDLGAEHASKEFTKSAGAYMTLVQSAIQVVASPAIAAGELAAFRGPSAPECMKQYALERLVARIEQGGASVTTPEVTQLPMSSPDSFGYRMEMHIYGNGRRIPVVVEWLGTSKARTEMSFFAFSVGPEFPAKQRDAMFAKVAGRTRAHGI